VAATRAGSQRCRQVPRTKRIATRVGGSAACRSALTERYGMHSRLPLLSHGCPSTALPGRDVSPPARLPRVSVAAGGVERQDLPLLVRVRRSPLLPRMVHAPAERGPWAARNSRTYGETGPIAGEIFDHVRAMRSARRAEPPCLPGSNQMGLPGGKKSPLRAARQWPAARSELAEADR